MVTETVLHVRLNERDQMFLDEMIQKGYVSNKSDAVRTALRLYQFSWFGQELQKSMKKQLTFEETMAELKKIRKRIYAREFGK